MAWIVQARQLAETGRWRMTATSDEDGGGPFGDTTHDHATAEEAEACQLCDEFCSKVTGMMSRRELDEIDERAERAEYERLKKKYGV